jgi:hypothetical protein
VSDHRVSFAGDLDAAAARAVEVVRREGVAVLDDLVDAVLVARCADEVTARYPHLAVPDRARNYGPYEGRHTIPLVVEDTLADPAIFVPAAFRRIAAGVLGGRWMVDSVGLLVAIPGAPDQKGHSDGTLFPEVALDGLLPAFALSFAMPLVRMDETSGRTAFWRGSHRTGKAAGAPDFVPTVEPGSALVWDYRVHHCGLANLGDRPRPVIFTVLSREWWVEMHPPEASLYRKLQVARPVLEGLSPRMQHRLHRAAVTERTSELETC